MKLLRRACSVALVGAAAVVWFGTPTSGQAGAVYGMTIPGSHPRLWWNAERISRARTWHASNPFSPRTQNPEDAAIDNAFLYILTNNAQYCRTAINAASSIIVNDAAANSPTEGVASNGMRWYGEQVILTYDWCHSQMTTSERDTLLNRWNFYLNNVRQHAWGSPQMVESNYNWGYMRNMIEWGITTWGENSMADLFLSDSLVTRWQNNFVPYAGTGARGGVWQEGSNYGVSIPDNTVVPFISASLLGRPMLTETDYQKEGVYYLIHATTPGKTYHRRSGNSYYEVFPFADDQRFAEGGYVEWSGGWGNYMAGMADHWRDEAVGQYARRWLNVVNAERENYIRAVDRGSAERDFSTLPLDFYASGPAFLYGRSQWGAAGTAFHLQLGATHDEGHGHNDLANWQIWRGGRWLARETTGYSNTVPNYSGGGGVDTNHAIAHNTILIGGTGGAVSHENPKAAYQMRRLQSHPGFSYASVNLTPAYASRAARVEREFLFIRSLETMLIFDRIDAGSTKTFLAHFEQNPTVNSGSRFVSAVNGPQALNLWTLLPAAPSYRVVNEGATGVGLYRLEMDAPGAGQMYFLNVLQAKGTTDASLTPSIADNGGFYTVTLAHPSRGTVTVTLEKGMTSEGGSVTIAGSTHPLNGGIQAFGITANGPVWAAGSLPMAPSNLRIVR